MLASYEKKDIDKKELNVQLISVVGKEVLASALKALVPDLAKKQPAEPRAFRWRALHELLKEDVPSDALEKMLAEQHSQLLRTLERKASADGSSNTAKRPAFPAPTGSAPSDVHVRACSSLLQLDDAATLKLLKSFEAEAYNDAQALRKANEAPNAATPALALGAAPAAAARRSPADPASGALPSHLRLELGLLQHWARERSLLLSCLHQLLALSFSPREGLHQLASSTLALLLSDGLAARLAEMHAELYAHTAAHAAAAATELVARVPERFRPAAATATASTALTVTAATTATTTAAAATAAATATGDAELARREACLTWCAVVGEAVAAQHAAERCQVAALLLLVTYAPHHAPALVQRACSPLSDAQLHSLAAALAPAAAPPAAAPQPVASLLEEAGWGAFDAAEAMALGGALDEPMPMETDAAGRAPAEESETSRLASRLARLEARAAQLETLALLAALLAELSSATEPGFTRGSLAGRHEPIRALLCQRADEAASTGAAGATAAGAMGVLLLAWCVVSLWSEPGAHVAARGGELAARGDELQGVAWCHALLDSPGFRASDAPEEISSISRELVLELLSGMVEQPRSNCAAAGLGWPAHSEPLLYLAAAALRSRPALCRAFWDDVAASRPLSHLLHHARYPLRAAPLPTLLAALGADPEGAQRAWAFAHRLWRLCHLVPRHEMSLFGVRRLSPTEGGLVQLQLDGARTLGEPPLALPDGCGGLELEIEIETKHADAKGGGAGHTLVLWNPSEVHALDIAPLLRAAVRAAVAAGAAASAECRAAAAAALSLLALAAGVHSAEEVAAMVPPPQELTALLLQCAVDAAARGSSAHAGGAPAPQSLLLPCLELLASLVPLGLVSLGAQLGAPGLLSLEAPPGLSAAFAAPASVAEAAGGAAPLAPCLVLLRLLRQLAAPASPLLPLPAALAAPLRFVVLRLLPMHAAKSEMAARCRTEAFRLLLAVLAHDGADAACADAGGVAAELTQLLLGAAPAHAALLDALAYGAGPLEAARLQQLCAGAPAAVWPYELVSARTAAALLGAALALLSRLLRTAHALGTAAAPLHEALLHGTLATAHAAAAPPSHESPGAVRWLALCVLQGEELEERADADLLEQASAAGFQTRAAGGSAEVVAAARLGPQAARCLALLCHAAPQVRLAPRLLPVLGPLAPALSSTLQGWIAAALAPRRASAPPTRAAAAEAAASAIQLLGAAAEAQPDLLTALCRGGLRAGEAVRVRAEVAEPEGGWGALRPAEVASVDELTAEGLVRLRRGCDGEGEGSWWGPRPSQLEACPPPSRAITNDGWKTADQMPADGAKPNEAPDAQKAAAAEGAAGGGGLPLLRMLLQLAADVELGGGSSAPEVLRDASLAPLALGVLLVLWQRPQLHAAALRELRRPSHEARAFWARLGALLCDDPDAGAPAAGAPACEAALLALRWHRRALCLSLLALELLRCAPPRQLLPPVAELLERMLPRLAAAPHLVTDALLGRRAPDAEGAHARARHLAAALGCPLPGGGALAAPALLLLECELLPIHARRQLPPPLWVGSAALPLLRGDFAWLDTEALQLRLSVGTRRADLAREAGGRAHEVALHAARRRVEHGEATGAQQLLERLAAANDAEATELLLTRRGWELVEAAAAANHAAAAAAAHGALARGWRQLIGVVAQGARALPVPAAAPSEAWGVASSEGAPLEAGLRLELDALLEAQAGWARTCALACARFACAQALLGTAELLRSGASVVGEGLPAGMVERLIHQPAWEAREAQLLAERYAAAYEQRQGGAEGAPLDEAEQRHRAARQAARSLRLEALGALLDDGSAGAAGGLHRLGAMLLKMLDELGALPGLLPPAASPTALEQARQAVRARSLALTQLLVDQLHTQNTTAATSDGAVQAALLALAQQLAAAASASLGLPPGTPLAAATAFAQRLRAQAAATCFYLDGSTAAAAGAQVPSSSAAAMPLVARRGPSFSAPGTPLHGPGAHADTSLAAEGALQLLQRARNATTGEARWHCLAAALDRLSHAQERLLQQATAVRAAAARAPDAGGAARRGAAERVRLLQLLQAALAAPAGSERVAAQLASALHLPFAQEAEATGGAVAAAEMAVEEEVRRAADQLLSEQVPAAISALACAQLGRAELAERRATLQRLWAGSDACGKIGEALALVAGGKGGEAQQVLLELGGGGPVAPANAMAALTALVARLLRTDEEAAGAGDGSATAAANAAATADATADVTARLAAHGETLHRLSCALALALEHEGGLRPQAEEATSAMLGVMLVGEAPALSFTLTPRGAEPRTLQPTGWLSDASGRVVLRAPTSLCSLLWPRLQVPLLACWQPHAAEAMRAIALHLASALHSTPPPPSHSHSTFKGPRPDARGGGAHAEAAALLLSVLHALLAAAREAALYDTAGGGARLPRLPAAEAEELLRRTAGALLHCSSSPLGTAAAPPPLLASLLLLLDHGELLGGAPGAAAALVPPLCMGLGGAAPASGGAQRPGGAWELQLQLLARLLPTLGAELPAAPRERLGAALLSQLAAGTPAALNRALLPTLLALSRAPPCARTLLSAGLLPRLSAALESLLKDGALPRYDLQGERTAAHEAWCGTLALATATFEALGETAAAFLPQAAVLLERVHTPLAAGGAGECSLAGVLEQAATLRLLAALSGAGGSAPIAPHLAAARTALPFVSGSLLLKAPELVAAMPPLGEAETTAARLLPSGAPLPAPPRRSGEEAKAPPSTVSSAPDGAEEVGSLFCAQLRLALQASLCACLGMLSSPRAMFAPAAAGHLVVGPAELQVSLTAALLGLQRLPNLACVAPHAHGTPPSRATLLCALARCVALAAKLELASTGQQAHRSLLIGWVELAADQVKLDDEVREQLDGCVREATRSF